ncbi:MAG: SsrA-binding protein SmpB [Clostridia bacterium]|nr:SsrA-binding protein SmpB [Clostridia bacterium]
MKVICENKGATFEYFIEDTIEAGISLDGGEVKSIRRGNVSLKDSYCSVYQGSMFIKNMHIAVYENAGAYNVRESRRERRLLLHKREIVRLKEKIAEKGMTVVPIKLYFSGSLVKVLLGVCRGKHTYDKKQTIKERDIDRQTSREIKDY